MNHKLCRLVPSLWLPVRAHALSISGNHASCYAIPLSLLLQAFLAQSAVHEVFLMQAMSGMQYVDELL